MRHSKRFLYSLLLCLLIIAGGLAGCNDSGGGGSSGTVTISGQVTGSGGLANVAVSGGGKNAVTDANGFYLMEKVAVPKDGRLVLSFAGPGRVPVTRIIEVANGKTYSVSVSLKVYDATSTDHDPAGAINIQTTIGANTVIGLEIPAGSIAGATGNVDISTFYGDPSTDDGINAFPGDFMAANSAGEDADTLLESIVFTEITIVDDAGTEITEFENPARVLLRLPDSLQAAYAAGEAIPWWSFDEEAGIWVREDAYPDDDTRQDATIVLGDGGILYAEAYVTHLSWWNVDQPVQNHAVLCVNVFDCETDSPLADVQVEARGVTYNGVTCATTDNTGKACLTVKRTMNAEVPEKVTLWARVGAMTAQYQVTNTALTEGVVAADEIFTPAAEGSTVYNTGEENWVILENKLCVSYDGLIAGTATYAGGTTPVANFKIWSNANTTAVTNSQGQYEMKVPKGTITLFAPGAGSQTVNVGDEPAIANFEVANRVPVVDSIALDPGTSVASGGRVTFTAQGSDPDNDTLTYSWAANAGSPETASGKRFTWTAPGGTGTATITLTVSDGKGGITTAQRTITYGGSIGGTRLSVTVKDSPQSDQPQADVYVILHGVNHTSVERFIKTGADGVADFGNIGRQKATITLAGSVEGHTPMTMGESHRLHTLVEIPVGDLVYYADVADGRDDEYWEEPSYQIDVNLNWTGGQPDGLTYVEFEPFGSGYSGSFTDITDVPVRPVMIQSGDTETISFLAFGIGLDYNTVSKYGFVTDQAISETEPYTVEMNRDPVAVAWNTVIAGTGTAAPVSFLEIETTRKGVEFDLADDDFTEASAGTIGVPLDFPLDANGSYFVTAGMEDYVNDSYIFKQTTKRYASLAADIADFPIPDLGFSDLSFAAGAFSWSKTGTVAPDVINLGIRTMHGDFESVPYQWMATLPPAKTGWTVPQLPAEISDWIDRDELGQSGMWEVSAEAFDAIDSYDDLLGIFASGGDPEATCNLIYEAGLGKEIWQENFSAMSLSGQQPSDDSPQSGMPNPLSGLLRR